MADGASGGRNVDQPHRQAMLANSLLRSALDAIIVMDEDGRVVEFNPTAEQIFGYTRAEAVGRPLSELIVPPAMRERHHNGYRRYIETGHSTLIGRRIEIDAMRRDGSLFPVEMTMVESRLDGERMFAAHMRDITEARRAMAEAAAQRERLQALEKLSALGSLLGGVAHELNNPLAVVLAQSTLLRERAGDPDVIRRADRILAAADRCARILKSFMAIARQKDPRRESCAIGAVLQDAIDLTAYGRRSAGVELSRNPSLEALCVDIDRDIIGQAIAHLLVFLQNGLVGSLDPTIAVHVRDVAPFAVLDIADNGPGLADHLIPRLFDAFSPMADRGSNTSIGLNMAHDAAEAHGGRLLYERGPDGGSVFRLFLPLAPAMASAPAAAHLQRLGPLHVLIVDDEADVGRSLGDLLGELGLSADWVETPGDALARLQGHRYDIVISDLRMPLMDGASFLQHVRDAHPRLAGRCVLATGDVHAADREQDAFVILPKPFTLQDIRLTLDRLSLSTPAT